MRNKNFINLVIKVDYSLPEKTICVSSKIYPRFKDTTSGIITRQPLISAYSLLKIEDLNVIESTTLNDENCLISFDLLSQAGCDMPVM